MIDTIILNYKIVEVIDDKFKCECTNCGHISVLSKSYLNRSLKKTSNNCRSCAKKVPQIKTIIPGKQYDKIIILEYCYDPVIPQKCWKVQCDCGQIFHMKTNEIIKRKKHRCLKCARKDMGFNNRKPQANILKVYGFYKGAAKSRKHSFELTLEQFKDLILKDCFYCNAKPSNKQGKSHWEIIYNGIDRVDNNKGYDTTNCVTCCRQCNIAKMNLSLENYSKWLDSIFSMYLNFTKGSETISFREYILSRMETEGILYIIKDNDIVQSA